jgi:hypothetical protein
MFNDRTTKIDDLHFIESLISFTYEKCELLETLAIVPDMLDRDTNPIAELAEKKSSFNFDNGLTDRYWLDFMLQPCQGQHMLDSIRGSKFVKSIYGTVLTTSSQFINHIHRNMECCNGGYVTPIVYRFFNCKIFLDVEGTWYLFVWVHESLLDNFRPLAGTEVMFLAWDDNHYVCSLPVVKYAHPNNNNTKISNSVKDLSCCIVLLKNYIDTVI